VRCLAVATLSPSRRRATALQHGLLGVAALVLAASLTTLASCRPSGTAKPAVAVAAEAQDEAAEAVALFRAYLRIDTTNPPGHEERAAAFLKGVLDREGIENHVFDLGNDRAVLYAVLHGNGEKRPVVLLHHMDVVPAEAEHWHVPPFSGDIKDGEVYGRGAVDIKGKGTIDLVTLVHLWRRRVSLRRDIILLAVADEEEGSLGSRWMVENQAGLLRRAEFLIDEGASIELDAERRPLAYSVAIGEKAPLWLTITFSGKSGHGSVPIADSAVDKAVRAAGRIIDHRTALSASPELAAWLRMATRGRDLARLPGFAGDLESSLSNQVFLAALADSDPDINAALRNTVAITGLRGSESFNVIPNEASLQLDCRLLPGSTPKGFIDELRHVVDDPSAVFAVNQSSAARESPPASDFMRALERVADRRDPGVPVVPTLLVSSTDSSYYRSLGINAYGFEPYRLTSEEADLAHGNDERLSAANLLFGIDLLTDLLLELNRP
jgi:acetylornithine deacetylase/succinyl-diaminopimelate desuccinylase-like protein